MSETWLDIFKRELPYYLPDLTDSEIAEIAEAAAEIAEEN